MKLIVKDKKFGNENYQYHVWVNEKKVEMHEEKYGNVMWVECPENSNVRIDVENILFREKKVYFLFIFYWVAALLSGYGERSPFGYPFNAVISINIIGRKDLVLEINSIWKKNAFRVSSECEIIQNSFYSPEGYKRKWFLGFALPISMIILVLFTFFICMDYNEKFILLKWIFAGAFLIAEVAWCIYAVKILSKK